MRWSDGITNSMDMNLSKIWELVIDSLAYFIHTDRSLAYFIPWDHKESDTTEY